MNTLHARLIADYCKRSELEAMLLDERLAYFAMHEAEEILTEEQMRTYGALLAKLKLPLGIPSPAGLSWYGLANISRATAAQRAECFLRCLNLWTETPA